MSGRGQHTGHQQEAGGELVVELEHPVVNADLVQLQEAAGGLGHHIQEVSHVTNNSLSQSGVS